MISEWTSHLWQSTIFSLAAGMLTVAFRRNRAQVRYWLWFSASLKFLIPFSLLINLGNNLRWAPAARKFASLQRLLFHCDGTTQPFHVDLRSGLPLRGSVDRINLAILAVWMCGVAVVILMRFSLASYPNRGALHTYGDASEDSGAFVSGLLEPGSWGSVPFSLPAMSNKPDSEPTRSRSCGKQCRVIARQRRRQYHDRRSCPGFIPGLVDWIASRRARACVRRRGIATRQ